MKKCIFAAVVALALGACTTYQPVAIDGDIGSKQSQTTAVSFLFGLLNSGDNSIVATAKNGGITHVSTVDVKVDNYLGGLLVQRTTIITGE